MKSIKTILSHDKNVAKFLSSEFSVCIRDCQFVKHGLRPANCIQSSLRSLFMRFSFVKQTDDRFAPSCKLHSQLASLAAHAFAPCKTWTASCKLHSELASLAAHAFFICKTNGRPLRSVLQTAFATRFARCSCVCGLRQKKSAYKLACSRFFCLNPCFTNHPLLRCSLRKRWSVLRRSRSLPYWHRHTGIPTSWIQVLSHSPGKGFRSLGSCSVDFPDT